MSPKTVFPSDFDDRQTTTGSDDMDSQTGNTYITECMIDIVEIATASLGFSTTTSSKNVCTDDSNNSGQPEMAAETGKTIFLELWQTASKFKRQIWGLQPRWAWKVSPSDFDNDRQPKWQYWRQQLHCYFRLSVVVTITWWHFFKLAVVENPRFAVGIWILSVIVSDILSFPVCRSHCNFRRPSVSTLFFDTFFELAIELLSLELE